MATWGVWGVGQSGAALHADDWVFYARSQSSPGFHSALVTSYKQIGLHRCLGFAYIISALSWADANPVLLRAFQVLGHAVASLVLCWLAVRWGASIAEGAFAATIFLVFPSGWNAVTWHATGYAPWAVALSLGSLGLLTASFYGRRQGVTAAMLYVGYAVLYAAAVLMYEAVAGVALMAVVVAVAGAPKRTHGKLDGRSWGGRPSRLALAIGPVVLVAAGIWLTQPADFPWRPSAGIVQMGRAVLSVQYHLLDHVRLLDPADWFPAGLAEAGQRWTCLAALAFLALAAAVLLWHMGRPDGARSDGWLRRAIYGLILVEAFSLVYVLRGAIDTQSRHRYAAIAGLALAAAALGGALCRAIGRRTLLRASVAAASAAMVLTCAILARGITSRYDRGTVLEANMMRAVEAQLAGQEPTAIVIDNRSEAAAACRVPESDMAAAQQGWVVEEYFRHAAGLPCPVLAGRIVVRDGHFAEAYHPDRTVRTDRARVFVWHDGGVRQVGHDAWQDLFPSASRLAAVVSGNRIGE